MLNYNSGVMLYRLPGLEMEITCLKFTFGCKCFQFLDYLFLKLEKIGLWVEHGVAS